MDGILWTADFYASKESAAAVVATLSGAKGGLAPGIDSITLTPPMSSPISSSLSDAGPDALPGELMAGDPAVPILPIDMPAYPFPYPLPVPAAKDPGT